MCGIAGILRLDGAAVDRSVLGRMTDALTHRGPDGRGEWTAGPIGLGHRRLKIIDLSDAAAQPMATEDGRYVISYNGELYNYVELRKELEPLGHRFRSRSDTEVVLHAFVEWGEAALDRFNGMFAFAVWDARERELFLARDRYGIKPLYWTEAGGVLLFASEIKAMLRHPAHQTRVDLPALLEYFTFQNFFTDRTLFRDVRTFPPGCFARLRPERGQTVRPQRYWDYRFREPEGPVDEREVVEELDRLFRAAVERQLVSDVEIGAYLSGGMDSGSITAVAARTFPYIKSFTCGFDMHSASGLEISFDEREKAELMSNLFKTEHYEMVLKSGDLERVMPRLAYHMEEPRVGQSYPNFYAAQLASKFVKVVLSGGGGDEMFAGYPWRYYRAVVNDDFEQYIDKYYLFWQRLIPNKSIHEVFAPVWGEVKDVWTRDIFRDVFTEHASELTRPEDYVNHSLTFEAKTFLHGLLLMEDKLSMAHGLETRLPFLDNELVDFAMQVPMKMKLGNLGEVVRLNENEPGHKTQRYFNKTRDGKLVLRQAMARHVPEEIHGAVKQGFSAPDASWFKGESIDYLRRTVLARDARIYDMLDYDAVGALVGEHLSGTTNRRLFIWSLLAVENWFQTFLSDG